MAVESPFLRRVSLLVRMAIAVMILLSCSLVVVLIVAILSTTVTVGAAYISVAFIMTMPKLSPVVAIPAWLVAVAAGLGLTALEIGRRVISDTAISDSQFITSGGTIVGLGCLYLVLIEGFTAIILATPAPSTLRTAVVLLGLFTVFLMIGGIYEADDEMRAFRDTLIEDTVPAADAAPDAETMTRRLAQLGSVSVPAVRVLEVDRPESFTLGTGEDAMIVISTGVIDILSNDELEAVLAHELSHLVNGDSRIMTLSLMPVIFAEDLIEDGPERTESEKLGDMIWNSLFVLLKLYGQLGIAILSRGREWNADAGGAALTGSPAALASALATVDETRDVQTTDMREWEQTIAAMNILPPEEHVIDAGPFRTHPSTEDRIEALQRRAKRVENQ